MNCEKSAWIHLYTVGHCGRDWSHFRFCLLRQSVQLSCRCYGTVPSTSIVSNIYITRVNISITPSTTPLPWPLNHLYIIRFFTTNHRHVDSAWDKSKKGATVQQPNIDKYYPMALSIASCHVQEGFVLLGMERCNAQSQSLSDDTIKA